MPLNIKTYNMTGKTKNFGLERDYIFHLVTNLTKVLPWALQGGDVCDVLEYAINDIEYVIFGICQKQWQVVIELFL